VIARLLGKLSPARKSKLRGWYHLRKAELVRRFRSYDAAALKRRLRELGIVPGDTLLVHSAYGPLLGFQGNPGALIDAFREAVGPDGNLLMVSLPYHSSTREYLEKLDAFDVRKTPSKMGLVSETFRRRPGVLRSLHPTHPILALGPKAEWLVAGHEDCPYPCGAGSPFGKFLALGGKILFFGVTEYHFTFHHYLEDMIRDRLPFELYEGQPFAAKVIDAQGAARTVSVYAFTKEAISRRRVGVLFDELTRRGRLLRSRIGNTQMVLMAAASTVECTRELADRGVYFYEMPGQAGLRWLRRVKDGIDEFRLRRNLSPAGKAELKRDRQGLLAEDPGSEKAMAAAMDWLCRAQDDSASADGGVARDFSLLKGWATSYPETTGYIIPTFLEYGRLIGSSEHRLRARRMLDWLQAIQLPEGGFQGGKIGSMPVVPVVFNTGQILIGLAVGEREFGGYREPMRRAADWLVGIQDADGCWRKHASPFAASGDKTYDTHVAWGLFEAERVDPGRGYAQAALLNVDWALTHQRKNGWFDRCCLTDDTAPLAHTLGYALRGVLEAFRFTGDPRYLRTSRLTADGLLGAVRGDGSLPGRLRPDWSSAAEWACLTGIAQISICWSLLYRETGEERYRNAALAANRYLRRTIGFDLPPEMAGAVKGSFPADGNYCKYEYPNWAAKFFVDALMLESGLGKAGSRPDPA
jgi:aminoglycoside N3'-acetyltransferase